MTQFTLPQLQASVDDGSTLSTKFNGAMNALYSTHAGVTAPPSPTEGMFWADTVAIAANPKLVTFKTYQAGAWYVTGVLNLTANTFTNTGAYPITGGLLQGDMSLPVGSAAAPSLSWAGSPNTGFYSVSGRVRLSIGGADRWIYNPNDTSTMSNILVQKASPVFLLDKTSGTGQSNLFRGAVNGVPRFDLVLGSTDNETGANTGSNFSIFSFDDAGAFLRNDLTINRATGDVTIPRLNVTTSITLPSSFTFGNGTVAAPSIAFTTTPSSGFYVVSGASIGLSIGGVNLWTYNNAAAGSVTTRPISISPASGGASLTLGKAASGAGNFIQSATAGVNRWRMFLGDATAEAGANSGSNFSILRMSDAGASLGTALSIDRATGDVSIPSLRAAKIDGAATGDAPGIRIRSSAQYKTSELVGQNVRTWLDDTAWFWDLHSPNVQYIDGRDWGGTFGLLFAITGGANLIVFPDVNTSDVRLKTNISETRVDALAAIIATPIVEFSWTDAGMEKARTSARKVPIGMVAQSTHGSIPEMALYNEDTDEWVIKRDEAVPYLLRAIQQLEERIRQLEARP